MVRLTRVQQQRRTRAAVLTAAREEFTERGYADAKVDRIAERAELTRGAVYSNFVSKRALYLAVLVALVEDDGGETATVSPASPAGALGAFARVWLERLPLAGDTVAGGHLQLRSLSGVLDDGPARIALAHTVRVEALLLALALEALDPVPPRRVRLAELALTMLNGSGGLAETAPGFGDPFAVARACEHLAGIDLDDTWAPPHLPFVAPATLCRDPWTPPAEVLDEVTGRPVDLDGDGVVAVLGSGRLGAAEEAVRSARPHDRVTVVVATADPAEIGRLVRLQVADLSGCLRRVFAPAARPTLRVVTDGAAVTTALGLTESDDETEIAVRVRDGEVVARARGRGAAHAAALGSGVRS